MTDPIRSALEAAREALRLLLATPEIADAHPADKDEETHVAERKARASISQIDAALASLDAPEGRTNTDWRTKMIDVHKLASEYEFRGDAGDYTPTEAERAMLEDFGESLVASLDAPQHDALREAGEALESGVSYMNALNRISVEFLTGKMSEHQYANACLGYSDGPERKKWAAKINAALARLKEGDSGATDQPKGKR